MTETSFFQIVVLAREQGASIRAIASAFGMSKSTLHRYLPAIEAIAADESQMGQGANITSQETAGASRDFVPNGTAQSSRGKQAGVQA